MKTKFIKLILPLFFSLLCFHSLFAQIIIASCPSCANNCTEDAQTINLVVVQGAGAGAHIFKLCRKATAYNEIKFKTNGNFNISSQQHIWLDFGDGSPEIEIFPSSTYAHTYPISTTDADFFLKATIKESGFPDAPMATPKLVIKASYTNNAVGYTPPDEIWNIAGSHAYLKFADAHPGKLLRPVIFVDGIDFDLTEYTVNGQTIRHGSTGWDVFILGNDHSTPNPDNTLPSEFRNYPLAFQTLNENEYDIVFLDFKDGSDFIQNNGEVLISLIEAVNQRKAQDAINSGQNACENVVVGASMGGQIAKWAISTMEERNKNHQCHTYVSFDSPHKGAHIPLSLQALVYMLKESGEPEVWDKLNTPATHQLLQETLVSAYLSEKIELEMLEMHMCSSNIDLPINFGAYSSASQTRQNFVNEMAQLGYPQSTRNVAISCGTTNGSGVGYTMNQTLLEATIRQVSGSTRAFYMECVNMGGKTLGGQTLIGPICTKHLIIRNNSFFMGAIPIQFVWQLNPFVNPPGKYLVLNGRVSDSFSNFDGAPGCLRGDLMTFKQELLGLHTSMEVPIPSAAAYHSFMPTLSLLDVNWDMDNDHLFMPFLISEQIANGNIPFDAAYAPNENLRHVELTQEMIDWLMPQIQMGQDEVENESLNLSSGQTFNYGKRKSRVPNTTIIGGATLAVNLAGHINFQTPQDPLSDKSHFNVYIGGGCQSGKIVKVKNNGKLQIGDPNNTNKLASFFATANSTVHIENNGLLRISNASQLIIQKGATLILDAGAKIQLDDPEAKIRIEGTLIVNGDYLFSGQGFIELSKTHTLTLAPNYMKFRLYGHEIDHRCLRLDEQTTLNIPNLATIDIRQGGIEYGWGSQITLGSQSNANFIGVRFFSNGNEGLALDGNAGVGNFTLTLCKFQNLYKPIEMVGGAGNTIIQHSIFEHYSGAPSIYNRPVVKLISNQFRTDAPIGIDLQFNLVSLMTDCNFTGTQTGAPIFDPLTTDNRNVGVNLEGGWIFWMRGGEIFNFDYGISNKVVPTNILMSDNATIKTVHTGIVMRGDATTGLISMTCSRIIDARNCIFGQDVRLAIDVLGQNPDGTIKPRPNQFLRKALGGASKYIQICHRLFNPPTNTITARSNNWGTTTGSQTFSDPNPADDVVLSNTFLGGNCSSNNMGFVFAPLANVLLPCSGFEECPPGGEDDCVDDCVVVVHGPTAPPVEGETVKQAFLRGMEEVNNEQFTEAQETFQSIANIREGEPVPTTFTVFCEHLISASVSLSSTGGERDLQSGKLEITKIELDAAGIAIYPNPTTNLATLILPKKHCRISVSDVHGKMVFEVEAAESIDISTINWQDGVYFITIEPIDKSTRIVRKKLLVQRL